MDDLSAITRIKQGDLNGLEPLVRRYQAQAVQAAYLIVYDRALAEDVAQSAFVTVAERIHQFDEDAHSLPGSSASWSMPRSRRLPGRNAAVRWRSWMNLPLRWPIG